jgi:hypothetical protein
MARRVRGARLGVAGRANAEGARVDAEGARVDAEGAGVDAEGAGVDAEGARVDAEGAGASGPAQAMGAQARVKARVLDRAEMERGRRSMGDLQVKMRPSITGLTTAGKYPLVTRAADRAP